MAAFDSNKLAFFNRNLCSQDGIYGNASASADVSHGDTLDNIFHPSLGRYAQLQGNDATVTIELRDQVRNVQAIHLVADLTSLATITIKSKNLPSDAYTTHRTIDIGTQSGTGGTFLTNVQGFAARKDPPIVVFSAYLTAGEQTTVLGHAFWQIRLQDPGLSVAIPLRKVFLGPGLQFLTEPGDGVTLTFEETLVQEGVQLFRGVPHSNFDPMLRQFAFSTQTRTESELADFRTDMAHMGNRPFFFTRTPDQGTITDATNTAEKWHTLYGIMLPSPRISYVPGAGSLAEISATIREVR